MKSFSSEDLAREIDAGKPFCFSRWGDGEWRSVFGGRGRNIDRHRYFSGLSRDLSEVLKSRPQYILGLQSFALRLFTPRIEHWIAKHGLSSLDWRESDACHYATIKGAYKPLLEAVKARDPLFVGPDHLLKVLQAWKLPSKSLVTVPKIDAYLKVDQILESVFRLVKQKPRFVSVSMGMPANLLIDRLHRVSPKSTLVDFGSFWDPYCGVRSRRYMKRIPLPELI